MLFLGLTTRNYNSLLKAFPEKFHEKSCLLYARLGAETVFCTLWGVLQSRFQALWLVMLFHRFTCLPWQPHSYYFYLSSWDLMMFRTSAETSLSGKPWSYFYPLWSTPLLSLCSHPCPCLQLQGQYKCGGLLFGSPSIVTQATHLCWYYWHLPVGYSMGKTENG